MRAKHLVRLRDRREIGGALVRITFDAEPALLEEYMHPGQFVELTVNDEGGDLAGYFAISSPVGAASLALIVRDRGGMSRYLLDVALGTLIASTAVLGAGFPVERGLGRDVLIVVVGSAISVLPPLLAKRDTFASTKVLIGERAPEDVPMLEDLLAWQRAGCRLTVCLSGGNGEVPGLPVFLGRVQEAALQLTNLDSAVIFAAGPGEMLDDLRNASPAVRVYTNL
jgi:NAD(P)H-flavin reductase